MSVTQIWKLDSPMHCRDFLLNLHLSGVGKVTNITTESGEVIEFKDMDDGQVIHYANEIAKMIPIREARE